MVTGGGNGIGRELVLQLLKHGAKVAAVDKDAAGLQTTSEKAGRPMHNLGLFTADISQRMEVEKLASDVTARFGRVDGLINNAGIIQPFVRIKDLDYAQIERVMNVNFYGTLFMTKVFLPVILKQSEGHIVNISSMGGFLPVPGQGVYGASKAAVKLLSEALYAELTDTRVRVTTVFPGAVDTDIVRNSGIAPPPQASTGSKATKSVSARDAASCILDAVESDAFRVIVGPDSRFMDRLYRFSPRLAVDTITRRLKSLLAGR